MGQVVFAIQDPVFGNSQVGRYFRSDPEFVHHPGNHGFAEDLVGLGIGLQNGHQDAVELAERLLEESDVVQVAALDAAGFEAVLYRVLWIVEIMLDAAEALFFRSSDQLTVAQQRGRRIMVITGNSQNIHACSSKGRLLYSWLDALTRRTTRAVGWRRRSLNQPPRDKEVCYFFCCHLMHVGGPVEAGLQLSTFLGLLAESGTKEEAGQIANLTIVIQISLALRDGIAQIIDLLISRQVNKYGHGPDAAGVGDDLIQDRRGQFLRLPFIYAQLPTDLLSQDDGEIKSFGAVGLFGKDLLRRRHRHIRQFEPIRPRLEFGFRKGEEPPQVAIGVHVGESEDYDVRMVLDAFFLQVEQHLVLAIALNAQVQDFRFGQSRFQVMGIRFIVGDVGSEGE